MKRVIKFLTYGLVGLCLIVVVALLSFDPLIKRFAQSRIEEQTGLTTEIGALSVGFRNPTVRIENFVLKNPTAFGGGVFLNMPELFLEYDRDAMREGKVILKLVRINIAEINIVENKAGAKNIDGLQKQERRLKASINTNAPAQRNPARQPPFVFDGIALLDVSLDVVKFKSEKNPDQNLDLHFGTEHELFKNLKTELDFQTAGLVLFLKAGLSGSLDFDSLLHQRSKKSKKSHRITGSESDPAKLNSTNP